MTSRIGVIPATKTVTHETVLANSNRRRMKAKFTPAVTGCVTATAPKV